MEIVTAVVVAVAAVADGVVGGGIGGCSCCLTEIYLFLVAVLCSCCTCG